MDKKIALFIFEIARFSTVFRPATATVNYHQTFLKSVELI